MAVQKRLKVLLRQTSLQMVLLETSSRSKQRSRNCQATAYNSCLPERVSM